MRVFLPVALLSAAAALGSEVVVIRASDARTLFLARCSACHDPGRVSHRIASRDAWREIVYRMQRMPQSGISKRDAAAIIDYLASPAKTRAPTGKTLGGRKGYGKEWLSILETATVRDGTVRIGGRDYKASVKGLTVFLRRGKKSRTVALTKDGKPALTSMTDEWRIGKTRYEVHLVLYDVRGDRVRVARALRRTP